MRIKDFPEREILLAAKTGFLSRAIWNEFYGTGGSEWRRQIWRRLKSEGFFKDHPSRRANEVYVLNLRNSMVRKALRTRVSRAPFVSQLDHDELVVWTLLKHTQAKLLRYFKTEIELKQLEMSKDQSLRDANQMKFPDAMMDLKNPHQEMRIALEVELTLKSPERYRQILLAYIMKSDVHRIVYVTKSKTITDAIKRAMQNMNYPRHRRPIGFVALANWQKDPNETKIDFWSASYSMRELANIRLVSS